MSPMVTFQAILLLFSVTSAYPLPPEVSGVSSSWALLGTLESNSLQILGRKEETETSSVYYSGLTSYDMVTNHHHPKSLWLNMTKVVSVPHGSAGNPVHYGHPGPMLCSEGPSFDDSTILSWGFQVCCLKATHFSAYTSLAMSSRSFQRMRKFDLVYTWKRTQILESTNMSSTVTKIFNILLLSSSAVSSILLLLLLYYHFIVVLWDSRGNTISGGVTHHATHSSPNLPTRAVCLLKSISWLYCDCSPLCMVSLPA
jgi:hypothetical protein